MSLPDLRQHSGWAARPRERATKAKRGAGSGSDAIVVARFADGTVQPMVEAILGYDCASRALFHVVIVSARAATPVPPS